MTTPRQEPRRDHTLIVEPSRSDPMAGAALRIKTARAEVRAIEAKRRTQELQDELAAVTARLDAIEHPGTTTEEPSNPAGGPVIVSSPDRPTITSEDVEWIIDGWRSKGWT